MNHDDRALVLAELESKWTTSWQYQTIDFKVELEGENDCWSNLHVNKTVSRFKMNLTLTSITFYSIVLLAGTEVSLPPAGQGTGKSQGKTLSTVGHVAPGSRIRGAWDWCMGSRSGTGTNSVYCYWSAYTPPRPHIYRAYEIRMRGFSRTIICIVAAELNLISEPCCHR